jgi:hypothetical protein
MRGMRFASKWVVAMGMTAAVLMATASPPSRAQTPDATLELSAGTEATGVGYSWASGTLHYGGRSYPFRVNGLSVIDLGVAIEASGVVDHLASLRDFEGTYTEVEVDAALACEGCTSAMKNEHGVLIGLQSTTQAMRFNPSLLGVSIDLGNGVPPKPD